MRLIRQTLLIVFSAIALFLMLMYFTLQSALGARWISLWINQHTHYTLSIGKIHHSFSSPWELQLDDFSLGYANQAPFLQTQTALLHFSVPHWGNWPILRTLTLENGKIAVTHIPLSIPLEALQLKNMDLHFTDANWKITTNNTYAGIIPFQPTLHHPLGENSHFKLSATSATLNQVPLQNVLIEGQSHQGLISLSNIGANLAQGTIIGTAKQQPDHSWWLDHIRLSHINSELPYRFTDLTNLIKTWPSLTFGRLDVLDSQLQGADWALNGFDLSLLDTTLKSGDWFAQTGKIGFNAQSIIIGENTFLDPIAKLTLLPDSLRIDQFSTHWHHGLLQFSGDWLNKTQTLSLDVLNMNSIHYILDKNWAQQWQNSAPDWLNDLRIKKLTVNHSQLNSPESDFPFQLTEVGGYGQDLQLIEQHKVGIWHGELNLNARSGSINGVDLHYPSIKLHSGSQQLILSDSSAFVDQGLLHATGQWQLATPQPFTITLSGKSVPLSLLKEWGWGEKVIDGIGNFTLQLQGETDSPLSIPSTLQGQLRWWEQGREYQQSMQRGEVQY